MHEYSIVAALLARVEREAGRRAASAVHRVHVRIGELSGVETGLLATAFRTFREGSVCRRAELDIHRVAAEWCCSGCRRPIGRGDLLECPTCGEPAMLARGDEIVLERIEMQVADV